MLPSMGPQRIRHNLATEQLVFIPKPQFAMLKIQTTKYPWVLIEICYLLLQLILSLGSCHVLFINVANLIFTKISKHLEITFYQCLNILLSKMCLNLCITVIKFKSTLKFLVKY